MFLSADVENSRVKLKELLTLPSAFWALPPLPLGSSFPLCLECSSCFSFPFTVSDLVTLKCSMLQGNFLLFVVLLPYVYIVYLVLNDSFPSCLLKKKNCHLMFKVQLIRITTPLSFRVN